MEESEGIQAVSSIKFTISWKNEFQNLSSIRLEGFISILRSKLRFGCYSKISTKSGYVWKFTVFVSAIENGQIQSLDHDPKVQNCCGLNYIYFVKRQFDYRNIVQLSKFQLSNLYQHHNHPYFIHLN